MTLQQLFSGRPLRATILLIWAVAIVLDAGTTWVALAERDGFREANPGPAWLMSQYGIAPTLLFGSAVCVLLAAATCQRPTTRTYALLQTAVAPLAPGKLLIALNNLRLLT